MRRRGRRPASCAMGAPAVATDSSDKGFASFRLDSQCHNEHATSVPAELGGGIHNVPRKRARAKGHCPKYVNDAFQAFSVPGAEQPRKSLSVGPKG